MAAAQFLFVKCVILISLFIIICYESVTKIVDELLYNYDGSKVTRVS